MIKAEKSDDNVFRHGCTPRKLSCEIENSMTVWDEGVIHNWKYEITETTQFEISTNKGNIIVDNTSNSAFELIGEESNCNGSKVWKTTNGLYIAKGENPLIKRQNTQATTSNQLLESEHDFQKLKVAKYQTIDM